MSALPTQPAQGFPVACPFPLPLPEADPLRVEAYWLDDEVSFAPVLFWSALDGGWGWL